MVIASCSESGPLGLLAQDRTQRAPVNVEWLKMFPDEHSRPARHALQMDMENGALVQCDFTAVIG